MTKIFLPLPPPKGDKIISSFGGGVPQCCGTEEDMFNKFITHNLSLITI
jgi:hypothetical protein